MKLIKRNGSEVVFEPKKIADAVIKANNAVDMQDRISNEQIQEITLRVEAKCKTLNRAAQVEEVQDMVERELMAVGAFTLAKAYITYRYTFFCYMMGINAMHFKVIIRIY